MKFNTAVSSLMILSNALERERTIHHTIFESFLKLLAPFAPHFVEELWMRLGKKRSMHEERWPPYDKRMLEMGAATVIVQVNGTVRGRFECARGGTKEALIESAKALPSVQKWIAGAGVQKVVVIPDRLVNIVTEQGVP